MPINREARIQAGHDWHTFARGARVHDPASGQDGTVISSIVSHMLTPQIPAKGAKPALQLFQLPDAIANEVVTVWLDNGETRDFRDADLIAIPEALDSVPEELAPPPAKEHLE